MPTTSTIIYYPSTVTLFSGMAIWYLMALAFLIVAAVIIFSGRKIPPERKSVMIVGSGIILFCIAIFFKARPPQTWVSPVFAPKTMVQSLWENYKEGFISSSTGMTADNAQGDETTSEAEGYTMLRAVWMDDEPTFDASWQWTENNLQRSDHLFSWLYGQRSDGTEGILTDQNGENSASDADTDIALSLVFAYSRWQNPGYLNAAVPIIKSIWNEEVFTVNGTPYLGTDNLVNTASSSYQLIDPSYFSPYAYRIFSFIDPQDNWQGLINSSYQILDKGIEAPLDASSSAGLPPDWMEINTATGALSGPITIDQGGNVTSASQTTDFGYDALRVPWRIALDYEWYGDPRDAQILQTMGFLKNQWQQYGFLDAVYDHDGTPAAYYQTPAMYGGTIGYFMVADPGDASAVYNEKLVTLYDPDTETWKQPMDYYDANIAWFGMALYNNDLPNLFALNLPSSTSSITTP